MKKITIVFAVLVLITTSTVFANTGDKVTKVVQAAFNSQFARAAELNWEVTGDFYFASFKMDEKQMTAAFNEKGELVGMSRKLLFSELPLSVSQSVKSSYADYVIADMVTEIMYEGQTFYFVSAEKENKILKLKCFSDGEVIVEKRVKK